MAYQLIYNDLIEVLNGIIGHGIYWLRLYSSHNHIATITEVPGNPSLSVGNGIESISNYICEKYKIKSSGLVLYQIWPDRIDPSYGKKEGSIKKVTLVNALFWINSDRKEIESILGIPLVELPIHDQLYQKVLQLGGGITEKIWQRIFEPVLVTELPFPHNPSRCKYSGRFNNMAKQMKPNYNSVSDLELAVGKAFLESITTKDLGICRYHRGDWKVIADESVRILETLGSCEDDKYIAAAYKSKISEYDRKWLISLFEDPIFIGGGAYTKWPTSRMCPSVLRSKTSSCCYR